MPHKNRQPVLRRMMRRHRKPLFSHRRHTAKVLHHKHTSYPLVAFVLLFGAVMIGMLPSRTSANLVEVTASVPAGPLPPFASEIKYPVTGDTITATPLPVTGTCPAGYFVKLFRNGIFSGSIMCAANGTFTITTDLFLGDNELLVRTVNAQNKEGPVSAPVRVRYDPTYRPASQFVLSPDHFFKAVMAGNQIEFRITFVGGTGPYNLNVNWGDGQSTRLEAIATKSVVVSHLYQVALSERRQFPVVLEGTDSKGGSAYLQVFSIVNDPAITAAIVTPSSGFSAGLYQNQYLSIIRYIWPAYLLAVLMYVCFWLGERRAFALDYARYNGLRRRT